MKRKFLFISVLISLTLLSGCASSGFVENTTPYEVYTLTGDEYEWKSDAEQSAFDLCLSKAYDYGFRYFIVLDTEFKTKTSSESMDIPFFGTSLSLTTGETNTTYICRKKVFMFNDGRYIPTELVAKRPKVYDIANTYEISYE